MDPARIPLLPNDYFSFFMENQGRIVDAMRRIGFSGPDEQLRIRTSLFSPLTRVSPHDDDPYGVLAFLKYHWHNIFAVALTIQIYADFAKLWITRRRREHDAPYVTINPSADLAVWVSLTIVTVLGVGFFAVRQEPVDVEVPAADAESSQAPQSPSDEQSTGPQ